MRISSGAKALFSSGGKMDGLKPAPFNAVSLILMGVAASGIAASAQVPKSGPGAPAVSAVSTPAAASDPLLVAMQQELKREQEKLLLPGLQRPYFMEYRLEDIAAYDAVANYGALNSESDSHQRVVRVEVRIGDYASDSSSSRGEGSLALAPQDNDLDVLKYALWTATDEAYKNALRAYSAKQAALKQFQAGPTADDFTPAKAVVLIEPLAVLEIDREEWKKRLIEASGLFATAPEAKSFADAVQGSTASLSAVAVNRYTVNTEGTVLRHSYSAYTDSISIAGQAADGMELARSNGSNAATAAGLEDAAALRKRTIANLLSFNALRNAAIVEAEDYHGPVLFSGDASADVFNRLFVPNVEADRPDIGTNARTQGAYQSSLKTPVLPAFLSVVDDPTMKSFEGKTLLGAYKVDDEGVPVEPVTIVDHGKLVNYLVGREPVKDFPVSNGHGRAALGQAAHSKAGVILIKSSQTLTEAAMQAKLLAVAKQQGRDVYEVETLGGELSPRLLYRVTPAGKRTLVRGAVFDELDQRAIRSGILAAGGKPYVAQILGPIPQSTIAPEVLFEDIGVKRANDQQQKLPYYAPPAVQ
ncbi:metallopeptidase TldD-related protein [Granulicella paludicola]|uniref:metallopeptidase TldD-related protein n=1 Tax=Granulicella paludicola TaxID=474951 RepID=UPI0021E0F2EB|nr:metallopeptidase TldD-related protein [Granulicella paludicola]